MAVAPSDAAVLIPVKNFHAAKGRLAALLDPRARHDLARWLAGRVAAAARPLPVFVACDDDEVARWADTHAGEVLWTPGVGLNGAIAASIETIATKGFDHVIVAHSDLPLADDLGAVATAGTITLVPDRWGDGTNVMALPADSSIEPSYGARSFDNHVGQALASGLPVSVRRDAALGIDVDTPADLTHPTVRMELPEWLQTILANRR